MRSVEWDEFAEWLYSKTANEDEDSARWLWWNFLSELIDGYLAYEVLEGKMEVHCLKEHKFWVIGILEKTGRYKSFSDRPKEEQKAIGEELKDLIRSVSLTSHRCDNALDKIELHQKSTLAAISLGRADDGSKCAILYFNPYFSSRAALAFLASTVELDDKKI